MLSHPALYERSTAKASQWCAMKAATSRPATPALCDSPPPPTLSPKVLVQVAVCDLLQWLNLIDWYQVAVQVHELDGHLLEAAVGQQVTLDALQRLVGVVIRLGTGSGGVVAASVRQRQQHCQYRYLSESLM